MNAESRTQSGDIVTLEHIFFSYRTNSGGTRSVLRDVNLSLKPHHRIGLYGPNGSGKTTLLRCITGLNRPSGGRVLFHGREMKSERDFHDLRVAVGFVLQNADDQLFFPTVLEDVAFGPLNLGMSPDAARERAIETLKSLGMSGFEGQAHAPPLRRREKDGDARRRAGHETGGPASRRAHGRPRREEHGPSH